MPIFPTDHKQPDDKILEAIYADIIENGFGDSTPINWFTSQAIRPDILGATWNLTKKVLVEGELPPTLKQMIALSVSRHNNCRYCTVTHTNALASLGISKEVIDSCIYDPDFTNIPLQHRGVLKFAVKVAKDPNSLQGGDFQTLKENGLSQSEIAEIIMMVAFTNFINTWADATGLELDQNTASSPEQAGS